MLIIGRVGVFVLSLFLAVSTTAAFAQVDVDRLAKRLEKLEAENDALKQRLRRLERVEAPAKVSRVEAPAVAAPVLAPPLKQVSLQGKPFEGAYGLVFGSLVSGNMDLTVNNPPPSDPYINYGSMTYLTPTTRNISSIGFGAAIGYNVLVTDKFVLGAEARASLPRWATSHYSAWGSNPAYPVADYRCYKCGLTDADWRRVVGWETAHEDRFKFGADMDLSLRSGLIFSNTLIFGRGGLGIQHAQQISSSRNNFQMCADPSYDPFPVYWSGSSFCSSTYQDVRTYSEKTNMNFPYLVLGLGLEHDLGPVFLRLEAEARNYFKSDKLGVRMAPGLGQRINAGVGVRF